MADLIWGYPLEGGETVPGTKHPWAYKVSADGTRRIEPHRIESKVAYGRLALA